jgi:hypothetical protein
MVLVHVRRHVYWVLLGDQRPELLRERPRRADVVDGREAREVRRPRGRRRVSLYSMIAVAVLLLNFIFVLVENVRAAM